MCDLTKEVATGKKVHDEQLVRALLNASLEGDDGGVLRDELVETNLSEEGARVGVCRWSGDALDGVVFWVLGGRVGVEGEVGDAAAAFTQHIHYEKATSVDARVDGEHCLARVEGGRGKEREVGGEGETGLIDMRIDHSLFL